MAGSSTNPSLNPSAPKILLAKPSVGPVPGKFGRGGGEDETAPHRARLPPVGSLNLLSDSWEFHIDRFLPFLTENTDFKVVGIIGPPGVGKSTIMNELYGFDGISPGWMLPPFAIQSDETRTTGQGIVLPSVLSEIMRPDGSSTVSVLSGESLSAELAHEIMNIQSSTSGPDKESKDKAPEAKAYIGTPVFVHTRLQDQDLSLSNILQMKKALLQYFSSSSFTRHKCGKKPADQLV
ncbi:Copine family isoform 1 [Hibiscus syriacus]|uniref:Copine family isoform 1 n=1 Tax=Hibiscus syriacus TaxID=106335 RepID=A0A6A3D796_HIBSY|nr:Copine family isoform 1 [Hibiscus syriacus]